MTSVSKIALCLAALTIPLAATPILGQVDDFESGTTENWTVGVGPGGGVSPVPPTNVPDGGPNGNGDHYLWLRAIGGNGPGSRLSVQNLTQWAGDYVSAGVGSIRMDVNNLGSTDLSLRLFLAELGAMGPVNAALSDAILVPSGAGWQTIVFPIAAGQLTPLLGSASAALMNASELRLVHDPNFGFPPPAITASLGVDNITAGGTVPEPATVFLQISGLALLAGWARLRRN